MIVTESSVSACTGARSVEASIAGPAGRIELILDTPQAPPWGVAIVAHPHPLLGGHATHKVPAYLSRGLVEAGWLVARPNFRGVGATQGAHDHGVGEAEDVLAVIEALGAQTRFEHLVLVGFSFGAFVQARVAREIARRDRPAWKVFLAGMPCGEVVGGRSYDTPADGPEARVVHGELDERVPLQTVLAWARPHSRPVVVIPGADHFFQGRLHRLRAELLSYLYE